MPSTITLNPTFSANMQQLADGMQEAAHSAMRDTMQQAEEDARAIYRWRRPGMYEHTGDNGITWKWEVTGLSAASLTGYVVSALRNEKTVKQLTAKTAVRFRNDVDVSKINEIDPSLIGDHSAPSGRIVGIVTMYTSYAPDLQEKEISGGMWGQPTAGEPVTIEVLRVHWDNVYIPQLLRPHIEAAVQQVAARLRS